MPDMQRPVAAIESQVDTVFHRLQQPPAGLDRSEFERVLEKVEANAAQLFGTPTTPDAEKGGDLPEMEYVREYQPLEKLGEGGMGAVYKARHTKLDRIVALKVLPARAAQDEMPSLVQRRRPWAGSPIRTSSGPTTPVRRAARYFLVIEYVQGLDLSELVRRAGPLPVADACELIRQAAVGLQFAHEHGLVHRDIKPSNLMITQQGQIKLLDLGLARFHSEDAPAGREVTAAGQTMGTPDYMAPEQIADTHTVNIRADIYALGCTLYKLLAGRPPFSGPEYRTAFDKQKGQGCMTCMAMWESGVPMPLERITRQLVLTDD